MTKSSNILVVEDRADWQDIVCSVIANRGYAPNPVTTYDEAIYAIDSQKFDLAVIDPVLDRQNRFNRDGLSVIQRISEKQPETPVVIITGSLTHDIRTSLQRLCPAAPVFFKESWNEGDFTSQLNQLVGQEWGTLDSVPPPPSADDEERHLPALPQAQKNGYPRVLVVENNENWQSIASSVLNQLGCYWQVASDAQEATQYLDTYNFHLVVLDLKLQQNNLPLRSNEGWLLLDDIVENRPRVKVVIMSGKASPSDVADLLTNYPVVRFIEKQNFSASELQESITEATKIPQIRLQTFRQFRLWRNEVAVGVWESAEAEMVLKLLLARRVWGERAVAADEIISRLWVDEIEGRRRLLPAINGVRRLLQPDVEPQDSKFIIRSDNGYFINLHENIDWDLLDFRQSFQDGQRLVKEGKLPEAVTKFKHAENLYRGDFLAEERSLDWANDTRRQIIKDFCALMANLADAYAAQNEYGLAIEACQKALRKDPLIESVYQRLMRFHYCQGDKAQALKSYRDCIKLFEELFGESPTSETRKLYQIIVTNQSLDC